MRIAEVIKLLASPFPAQIGFLGDIPENAGSDDFTRFNPVYRMASLYLESTAVYEGEGGSEGEENWLSRTGLSRDILADREHPLWQSMYWLTIALEMLMKLDKPFLFTKHGLRSAHEWKLIRHLASDVCEGMDWPFTLLYPNFEALWDELGDGVIDERS